jgi:hypothetical protein
MASQRAVFSASSGRMDTAHQPAVTTASWNLAIFSAQNSTSGGVSETEVNALTVMAWPLRVVTTTMPLANWPAARRNEAASTPVGSASVGSASGLLTSGLLTLGGPASARRG